MFLDPVDEVIEPASGIAFPKRLSLPSIAGKDGKDLQMDLAVCAIRKIFVLFQTYAIGLYLDLPEAIARCKDTSDESPNPSRNGLIDKATSVLADPSISKVFRITSVRDSEGSHTRDALIKSLKPRLATFGCNADEVTRIVAEFKTKFPKRFLKAESIDFLIHNESVTVITKEGKGTPIHSVALCNALIDMYVGENTKMPEFKKSAVSYLNNRALDA